MAPETVVHIISQVFWTTLWVTAPLLLSAFVVGVVINLIQITTSLQDPTFSTIPRLAIFLFGFLTLMPWMIKHLSSYAISIFGNLGQYAH